MKNIVNNMEKIKNDLIEFLKKNGKGGMSFVELYDKFPFEGNELTNGTKSDKVRYIAKPILLGVNEESTSPRILIFDLETSIQRSYTFWTGKTYISHGKLVKEDPKIMMVGYKWLGDDKVSYLLWDDGCDKQLMKDFVEIYNQADLLIGFNNDSYDNKWVHARAAKYGMFVNTKIPSFDIMREAKKVFRIPSYSMKYMCEYFGVQMKLSHEGMSLWIDSRYAETKALRDAALEKVRVYGIGDIISTEELLFKLRKYFGHKIHFGALMNGDKLSCPSCASNDLKLLQTTTSAAGTIKKRMTCNNCECQFNLSNSNYLKLQCLKD